MELQLFEESKSLLDRCLKIDPHIPDAQKLEMELYRRAERAMAGMWPASQVARKSPHDQAPDHVQKSTLGSKALKAFGDYGAEREKRSSVAIAAPPIESLPHHGMGLPREQVEMMDEFFRTRRAQEAEKERRAREEREAYERVKREWRERAEDGVASGRLEPLERILPSERSRSGGEAARPASRDVARPAAADAAAAKPRGARLLRQLDQQAAEEKRSLAEMLAAEVEGLSRKPGGEPTRFEQAGGEVYCWWALPEGISARDVRVTAGGGGARLRVELLGKPIFDGRLFDTILVGDLVWSVSDGELHVTLTKADRNRLWEQLGIVEEVRRDESGNIIPESLPAPMSMAERLDKFRQMVQGDDGQQARYDDLDPRTKQLVDVLRRYEHARAVGDHDALALAELDLEEFGQITI
mmetsp:Transcript_97011/g.279963  ORF Transcript_97011/g.279963 Transcript_97011/m.279963 type:complete len:412 (-) Transcript_97011:28-1263(-)